MSYPFQRFFSLSSSSNNPSATAQAAPAAPTTAAPTSKFVDHNSLDLLVRAASGGGATPASNSGSGNNNTDMNNGNNGMYQSMNGTGATPDGNSQGNGGPSTPTVDNTNNNHLQQAFLQSLASQQAQGAHPSAIFGAPSSTNAHPSAIFGAPASNSGAAGGLNLAGASNPAAAAQQFGQLFGNMATAQQGNPQGNIVPSVQTTGTNHPQDAPQAQVVAGTPNAQAAAGGQQGNNMISQLVASLQAQQQAQQQAQVQSALFRAFGPGANTNNLATAAATGNPLAAIQAQATAGASANGTQGMGSGMPAGLNTSMATAAATQAGSLQQNTAARDLLSRMQLAQSVQQQQHQVQQQQQQVVQAQQQQHQQQAAQAQQQQQQQQQQVTPNGTFDASKAATSTAISAGNATADDLIKLQFEQERHNRMLQMVQADRQERAMLANQEAMMKKQRRDVKKDGSNVGDLTAVTMNDAVKNMVFNQFPNANTAGFPNAASSLLTALPGLNQNLANNLQNGLINAASGLPNLAGLGAVGGDATVGAAEQHLHQKLGSARGAAIVPCRARGMPVDHNFKTAYFVIPDAIEHGDELMCSYPACRQAGVKFRYCLHCKVPVAKRNFRNRHRHGVSGGDEASDMEEESEEEDNAEAPPPVNGDICHLASAAAAGGEDDDYSGVKKEHILIVPGAQTNMPMKKKKKKSGNVRVPCRARGMPMAHNFKTAYFIIPPTIEHGDELLCSFPSCRSAGAKFRYCLHCKVPVAKRNFRNRHKHGNMDKKKSASANLKSPEGTNDEQKGKVEEGTKPEESTMPELTNVKSEEGTKPLEEDAKPSSEPEPDASNQTEAAAAVPVESKADDGKVTISSSHNANKVQKWVELLENKPNPSDKQAMAVWMLNLMNATEGSVPPVAGAPASVEPSSAASSSTEHQVEEPSSEKDVEETSSEKDDNDPLKEEGKEENDSAVVKPETSESKPLSDGAEVTSDSTSSEEGQKHVMHNAEENDAESTLSSSSQPPKKKFKQEFEEV